MYLGVDIGGTKTAVCLGTETGEILKKVKFATEDPQSTIDRIIEAGKLVLEGKTPTAIGVSCGSPQDSKRGIIQQPPNLPKWVDVPITQLLSDAFGAPAYLCNDANACGLAEWLYGAGKGTENMIFLTFGTGLGAGLILDGRLYEGTCGMAGEVGHMRLSPTGPVGYGKKGSFEGFCSGGGIADLGRTRAAKALKAGKPFAFCSTKKQIETLTTYDICEAAKAGDPDAKAIIKISARRLGQGLAVLIDLFNPERIVIGSIFTRAEALFREEMEKVIKKEALGCNWEVCQVVPAALGESIGDIAAISVAVNGRRKNNGEN